MFPSQVNPTTPTFTDPLQETPLSGLKKRLRNHIEVLGQTDPERASILSRKIVCCNWTPYEISKLQESEFNELSLEIDAPLPIIGLPGGGIPGVPNVTEHAIDSIKGISKILWNGNEEEVRKRMTSESSIKATIELLDGTQIEGFHQAKNGEGRSLEQVSKKPYPKWEICLNGYGEFISDRITYKGNFFENLFHHNDSKNDAVYCIEHHLRYTGQFNKGERTGPGKLEIYDEDKEGFYTFFEGRWVNDQPYTGTFYDPNGNIQKIKNGKVISSQESSASTSSEDSPSSSSSVFSMPLQLGNFSASNRDIRLTDSHPNFIGRVELLKNLKTNLLPSNWKSSDSNTVRVLVGPCGIGKTETAIKFGNDHRDDFSLIWMIRSATPKFFKEDYRALADRLGIQRKKITDIIEEVHKRLENFSKQKPYLLIFDNVEETPMLPQRGGAILMTAQSHKVWLHSDALIKMRPFSVEEIDSEILKEIKDTSQEEIRSLVTRLEGFPILLRRAIEYIKDRKCSISDYLQELDKMHDKMHPVWVEDSRYSNALADVYLLTLQAFKKKNPKAFNLLQLCAYLNPDDIRPSLFEKFDPNKKGKNIKKTDDSTSSNTAIVNDYFQTLKKASLLQYDTETKTYRIHRALQLVLQQKHKKKETFAINLTASLLKEKLEGFDPEDFFTMKIGEECFSHVDFLRRHAIWEKVSPETQAELLRNAGDWLGTSIMQFDQLLEFQEKIDRIFEENQKNKKTEGSEFLESQFEQALRFQEEAYKILANTQKSENTPEKVLCLISLGNIHLGPLAEPSKAKDKFDQAYEMCMKLYGNKFDLRTIQSLMGLSFAYFHLNDCKKAEGYLNLASKIYEEHYQDEVTSHRVNQLILRGWIALDSNNYQDAEKYYNQALEIHKQLCHDMVTPLHISLLFGLGHISYEFKCDLQKAEGFFKEALEIHKQLYGDKVDYQKIMILYSLGMASSEKTNLTEAKDYFEQCLLMLKHQHGKKAHPNVIKCLTNLGNLYSALDNFEEAKKCYETALSICDKLHGENSKKCKTFALSGLGCILLRQNKEEGENFVQEAIKLYTQHCGDHASLEYVNFLQHLSEIYLHVENWEKAGNYYDQILAIYKELYKGEDIEKMPFIYGMRGFIYVKLQEYEKAKDCYWKAYSISLRMHGEEKNQTKYFHRAFVQAETNTVGYIFFNKAGALVLTGLTYLAMYLIKEKL